MATLLERSRHSEGGRWRAEANLGKHGVSFEAAAAIFEDSNRLEEDDAYAQGEYRLITVVDGLVLHRRLCRAGREPDPHYLGPPCHGEGT